MAKQDKNRVAGITNTLNLATLRSSDKSKYATARIWYLRMLGWTLVRIPNGWRFGWYVRKSPLVITLDTITGKHLDVDNHSKKNKGYDA